MDPKERTGTEFSGKEMVDRPRVQWKETVNWDTRNQLDIINWRMKSRLRDECKAKPDEIVVRKWAEESYEEYSCNFRVP